MLKKKILLSILVLLNINLYSNPINDFATKYILFYLSDFTATLSHELGHAFVNKLLGRSSKITMGSNKPGESDLFIQISSLNPKIGVTASYGRKKRNVAQEIGSFAMGPIFGISSKFLQLKLLNHYKDDLSENVVKSLENFIKAQIIAESIYGFTPFNTGDGAGVFNLLNIKYGMKTDLFQKIIDFNDNFDASVTSYATIYLLYNCIYITLKLINKQGFLDEITKKRNNVIANNINRFIKSALSNSPEANDPSNWPYTKLIECVVF